MKTTEVTRRFAASYDDVVTKAQSMQPQFVADINEFSSFDNTFTAEFGMTLAAETEEALKDFSAGSHSALILQKTEELAALRNEGIGLYKQILYYVHEIFGKTKSVDQAFGRYLYEKARNSEKAMIEMLTQAYAAANDARFNAQLLEKLGSAEKIESLLSLSNQLSTADNIQEQLKKQQLLVTSDRIGLYNSIWEKLSKISTAAKIIFADDPARLTIYRLYDGQSKTETGVDTEDNEL